MKKLSLAVAVVLAAAALPTVSIAEDGLAYNVGAVSDYRYRGISQSRLKPALQAGVDFTKGPFYLGAWASTIKWIKDAGGEFARLFKHGIDKIRRHFFAAWQRGDIVEPN